MMPCMMFKDMAAISQHKNNKIAKRKLKDLALDRNLIQAGKKDTQDEEECNDQAAYDPTKEQ